MSTPDPIRALLTEMADELDHNRQCLLDDRSLTHPLADRARAALARWGHPAAPPATKPLKERADFIAGYREGLADGKRISEHEEARRRPATPPAPLEGEVGELVEFLLTYGDHVMDEYGDVGEHEQLTRAATLLEQLSAAAPAVVPVAVSERLLGEGDCDAEGRCWWWRTDDADEWWELLCINDAREYNAGCGNARYTHWLPAHAIPLPAPQGGEVEA